MSWVSHVLVSLASSCVSLPVTRELDTLVSVSLAATLMKGANISHRCFWDLPLDPSDRVLVRQHHGRIFEAICRYGHVSLICQRGMILMLQCYFHRKRGRCHLFFHLPGN